MQAGMIHNAVTQAATNNGADEIVFRYSVMFEDDFEFDEDGKLPGAYALPAQAPKHYAVDKTRAPAASTGADEMCTHLMLTSLNAASLLQAQSQMSTAVGHGSFVPHERVGRGSPVSFKDRKAWFANVFGAIDQS
ncbi:hypothetical protein M0805_000728 [Coniferiporia weirii]|nr:hypothetical protein M0805_000728 [Coniferiporia weirii]